jgi:AcrR family transcriptional regulator
MSLREQQKRHRRDRILDAAIKLFRTQGFAQTTAMDIARAAQVSRGTFFNYFPYKEAVLLDFGAHMLANLRTQALQELNQGQPPLAVLNQLWERLADLSQLEQNLLLPLAYELLNPDPVRAKQAFEALPLGALVAEILHPLHSQGLRSDMSLERISRSIADTYLLAAIRWTAYVPGQNLKTEMMKFLNLMLHGSLARPTKKSPPVKEGKR